MSATKVLTVITQANGKGLEALYQKTDQFMARHAGIEVQIEQANGNFNVLNKIKSDEPADIIHLSESVFGPYLRQGLILDLMPYLQQDAEISPEDFHGGALAGPTDDGKLAALPVDIAVPLIYYRKKAFAEAGIEEPHDGWTFEEFREIASRLTKDEQYGLRLGVDIEWFEPFVKRSGGAYFSPDGSTAQGYVDGEATAAALQMIVDWFRVERIVPMPGTTGEGDQAFTERFAMVYDFSWWIPFVTHQRKEEYGVVGLPRSADGQDTTMMYMGGYGISSRCEHPEMAWELLKELAVPKEGYPLSQLPAAKSTAGRLGTANHPFLKVALAELDKASRSAFYVSQKWNANRELVKQDLMSWITEGAEIRASLRKWAEALR